MDGIITLFSFLETFKRAGEEVVTEAESGRFLLALRDLRVRWTILISEKVVHAKYSSLFWFEIEPIIFVHAKVYLYFGWNCTFLRLNLLRIVLNFSGVKYF